MCIVIDFVHYTDIDGSGFKLLKEGERVKFEPYFDNDTLQHYAKHVRDEDDKIFIRGKIADSF